MPSAPKTPTLAPQRMLFPVGSETRQTLNVSQGQSIGVSTTEAGDQSHHLAMGGDRKVVRNVRSQMRVRGANGDPQAPQSKEPTHRYEAPKYTTRREDNTDSKIVPRRPNAPRLWGVGVTITF